MRQVPAKQGAGALSSTAAACQSSPHPLINSQLAAVLRQDDAQLTPPGVEEVNVMFHSFIHQALDHSCILSEACAAV